MGILLFAVFGLGSYLLRKFFERLSRQADYNTAFILKLAGRAVSITLLVFGAVTALGTMGINVSALVAGLGLTGFALGFAFKDILSNLMALDSTSGILRRRLPAGGIAFESRERHTS